MSDADHDAITVSASDVTVRKTLDVDQFQTPAVIFDVLSEGEETLHLQVVDRIPDSIALDDVGFHPDYGAEYWSIEGREVVFERLLEPGQECTTIYGVRGVDDDELEALFVDPSVTVLDDEDDAIDGLDDLVSEEEGQAVRDLVSGERDSIGTDTAEPADGGSPLAEDPLEPDVDGESPLAGPSPLADDESPLAEEPPATDTESPLAEDSTAVESPLAEDAPSIDEDSPLAAEPTPGESSSPLAEEPAVEPDPSAEDSSAEEDPSVDEGPADDEDLSEPAAETASEPVPTGSDDAGPDGRVAPDDVPAGGVARVLAKELREGNVSRSDRRLLREELVDGDGSTDARIDHLQREVADLAAYTAALEEFLDEEGGARQVLADLRDEVSDVRASVAEAISAVDDAGERVDQLAGRVDALDGDVTDLGAEVADVDDDVDDLYDALGTVEDDLGRVEDRVSSNAGDLDELGEDVSDLADAVDGIDDDRAAIEDLSERTDELQASVDELSRDLGDVNEFRDRLSTVFGGGGVPGAAGGGDVADGPGENDDDDTDEDVESERATE